MFFSKGAASSTSSLVTGSLVASLINIALLPVIARAYGPTIIGIGAIFIAIHSFLTIIATGRYNLAIPLARSENTAKYLIVVIGLISTGFAFLVTIIALFSGESISRLLSIPQLSEWLPWLGLLTAVAGIFEAVNYWLVRNRQFHIKAILNVTQTSFFLLCLLLGAFLTQPTLDSYMLALLIGMFGVGAIMSVLLLTRVADLRPKWSRLKKIARYYRHLPKHMLTTSVINNASTISLPIVLAIFSGPVAVATYALVAQVIGKPFNLVSSSIWQVVYGGLGDAGVNSERKLTELEGIYKFTSLLYCIPLIAFVALSDKAVYILGDRWSGIGPVIGLFLIMAYFQYSSNSVSYFQSFGKYFAESVVNTSLIATRFGAIIIAAYLNLDAYQTILVFCLASALVYLSITTYWSIVFRLGLKLPLRGLLQFTIAYSIAVGLKEYFEGWQLYLLLSSILLLTFLACFNFYRRRSLGNAQT